MRPRAWRAWVRRAIAALAGLVLLALLGGWLYLRASLPQLDGEQRAAALQAIVLVERDADGVPAISGANRLDVAWAIGFVHAQERFFQMDLLRRTAAGELAELFGPRAVPLDKERRRHRFRARAARVLATLAPDERAYIERYTAGVNHGLRALGAKPFEYVLSGATPRPWSTADSLLVVWAMFIDLQGAQEARELARGWLRDHSDPAQLAFLLPAATAWDAPLDSAEVRIAPALIPPAAPSWWGRPGRGVVARLAAAEAPDAVGSNNYALAGERSSSGAAIVSNDMHLGLQLPNTWYRMALRYPDAQGQPRRIVGVTLPGAPPIVIVGSNGHVAWSFTSSYGDFTDLVALGRDAAHPGQVRTPSGWEAPVRYIEQILVKGAPAQSLTVRETSFGPIREAGGVAYAVRWIAHDPAALNLNHRKLETADTVDAALAIAATDGIPAQNFIAGDQRGNIGWTIAGILPRRPPAGADASFPLAPGTASWSGMLAPGDYPRIVNPPDGQLSTANGRQLAGAGTQLIGDGGFDLGARQRQLRDGLAALGPKTDVAAAFRIALDDRALFIGHWRERALGVLGSAALAGHPQRAEFRRLLVQAWDGRASVDSVGYRLARGFMWALHDLVFDGANEQMAALDPKAGMALATNRWPAVLARLLDERPAAWLPPGQPSWEALQLAAVDHVIAQLTRDGEPLAEATWGVRNTAAIAHPISMASPALRRWLAAPQQPQPGDAHMPRVSGPKFGQSERMTVSPGREEEGLFNMPGGQSGHPLSPFFLRGHEEWVQGKPVPLLPGPAKYTLRLVP
jgi:penicillin amidase